MIQRRKRKKIRKRSQLRQKKLQIKRNQLKKLPAPVKIAQMNLIVTLIALLMLSHNSSVRDLEPLQMLAVLMQRFKKLMLNLLFLKKIRKLNLVLILIQMIVIHQSLQLRKLLLRLLPKKLLLKRNHLQKNLMIQMIVNQAVPKMLSQLQKSRLNPQQRPPPKSLIIF